MNPGMLFPEKMKLPFYPEVTLCSKCGKKLNVLKTGKRKVVALSTGAFTAHETYLYCPDHGEIHRSEDLKRMVPFKCTFAYDVMVHVGKALYLRSMSEQAVIKELQNMGIKISASAVAYLGQKFIAYLTVCHHQSQLRLRLKMAKKGGYILHIDGTCEGDSPNLFTGMDEISGIILSAVKIKSEQKEKIIPFLKDIQEKYGEPLAVVSDMGKGLLLAIESVFPGIRSLICHFHFLRDIGKDLLDNDYRILRNRISRSKIRTALKNKAKDFEKKLGKQLKDLTDIETNAELSAIKTTLLSIYWIFETSSLSGYGFPFDMKHFLFYQRLVAAHKMIKQLYDREKSKPFHQFLKLLDRIIEDKELSQTATRLKKNEIIFKELRETLRITLPEGKQGLNDEGENYDIKTIATKVTNFVEKYESTTDKSYLKMIDQINKYYNKLFADPIPVIIDGKQSYIQPHRTNNMMEQSFRFMKRLLRKKSGNISVKRSLTAMLPGTMLIKNLENNEYLDLLLDGTSGLEERFSQIDNQLFLNEFSKMKASERKIPSDAKKLIKEDGSLEKIKKMYLATAS